MMVIPTGKSLKLVFDS